MFAIFGQFENKKNVRQNISLGLRDSALFMESVDIRILNVG